MFLFLSFPSLSRTAPGPHAHYGGQCSRISAPSREGPLSLPHALQAKREKEGWWLWWRQRRGALPSVWICPPVMGNRAFVSLAGRAESQAPCPRRATKSVCGRTCLCGWVCVVSMQRVDTVVLGNRSHSYYALFLPLSPFLSVFLFLSPFRQNLCRYYSLFCCG